MAEFQEPLYWASFSVYGRDSLINPEELRRSVAEASFFKAQKLAIERFELVPSDEGNIYGTNPPEERSLIENQLGTNKDIYVEGTCRG